MRADTKKFNIGRILLSALKWIGIAMLLGAACGGVGAAFSHSVAFVTALRERFFWILYLLPAGGLLSVLIYRIFKVTNVGTDDAVESAHSEKKVSPRLTPAVFICSVITHLFGGSAGREGAALKMGGGIAALFSRLFKLSERERRTLALAGMSGVFAAVFGTPVGAAVFSLEVVRSKTVRWWAIITSLISCAVSYGIARLLFVEPERYTIPLLPDISLGILWRVLVIAALGGLISYVFCLAMEGAPLLFKKLFKNDYVRIAVPASLIVILTVVLGTTDYNGGGIAIIEGIFEGESVGYEAFLLKILFTALTVGAGFKGGEIIPAFFVGATFGAAAAALLGISPAFGAAIGMTALFCGVTNCPIATLILSIEMFGPGGILFYIITVIISFLLSGEPSLYDGKKYPMEIFKREKGAL